MPEGEELSRFPTRKLDFKRGRVEMNHGSGGLATSQLIEQLFFPAFDNPALRLRNDQAAFPVETGRMVITTDSYVVSPLFFPGGDIGMLAVNGTVNDVAMSGAVPQSLSAAFILEEGFPLGDLRRIVASMAEAAQSAGVDIVTGDTKVVERGHGDGVFITTTGIGRIPDGVAPSAEKAKPGDVVLVNGTIGDHGIAILSQREHLSFESPIKSDTQALADLVAKIVSVAPTVRVLRDPTRGGLATTLNEICQQSGVGMAIEERAIPIQSAVRAACELLGIDPLYAANEGKLVAICDPADAHAVLTVMRAHPSGEQGAVIGQVRDDARGFVEMATAFGGARIVDWLTGEQLPRIC
jgi:hydrogenase expression/formation protein HypE